MQRLYSLFPIGLPGVGLLCLRLTVALSLYLVTQSMRASSPAMAWVTDTLCLLLVLGVAAPWLAWLCAATGLYVLIKSGGAAWVCAGPSIPVAIALALLGPGGYSVDARMFGRRSVVINDPSESSKRKH